MENTHNGHEFVDLGLPSGTLWATCNVGATSPEQAGLYFAWGETTGYTAEQVENGERAFDDKSYKAKDISTNLTLEQDAAHVHMGGKWRMPTKTDFQELIGNTVCVSIDNFLDTEVNGMMFLSLIYGTYVFLPAVGGCSNGNRKAVREGGYYNSSTYPSSWKFWEKSKNAVGLGFVEGAVDIAFNSRFAGIPIRGVLDKAF